MTAAARNLVAEDAQRASVQADTAAAIVRLQAEILRHRGFDAAATAFASTFAREAGCERVNLGIVRHQVSEVVAVSHHPSRPLDNAETREIASVMDEAIEQGVTVCIPGAGDAAVISLAHAALSRRRGSSICTVPLVACGEAVGAVCFERSGSQPFSKSEAETLEHAVCLLGPVLYLLWRDALPWRTRLAAAAGRARRHFTGPDGRRARAIAAAIGAVAVLLVAVPTDRQVSGRARIEGAVQRALVAPSDGFIQAAHVRPGDVVTAGQVLAELADKDLLLEKRRWGSQLAQYENAYASALARADRGLVAINMAKAAEAQANVALAESKLARARVEAPFDGVVIKGDLSQSIGAPVQQGDALLTLARTDGFRVIVEVDERDIRPVRIGQKASVALSASPWSALPGEVTRITPISTAVEGANVFEVEATLLEQSADVRPGLRGVAKITVGTQPMIFSILRRVTDWARLWFWSWVP